MKTKTKSPTKKQRRAAQLLSHYETCQRLGALLGSPINDGKKIAVALLKLEREAHDAATAQCNGETYGSQPFRKDWDENGEESENTPWKAYIEDVKTRLGAILGQLPPAFFLNSDARGYALKIDNAKPEGKAFIGAAKLHTDWGGYGILSPEIDGN